nr:hypothetical protein [uncultured Oribacterium sp.]
MPGRALQHLLRKERDMPSPMKKPSFNVSKKMKRNCIVLACIGALFLIGMTAFGAYNSRPVKIPLDKFYQVEFTGEDGLGEGKLIFQKEDFEKNYLGKIKRKGRYSKRSRGISGMMTNLFLKEAEKEIILSEVEYAVMQLPELSEESRLENGDHVSLSCKEDLSWIEKSYNVKLLWEDKDLVVKGLYERTDVNPFDFLDVQFTGNSPQMRVELALKNAPSWMELGDVNVSKREGLASGDKIQVTFYQELTRKAEKEHIYFLETEKEYEVPKANAYWTSGKDIPGDTLRLLQEAFMDSLHREMTGGTEGEYVDLSGISVQYLGNYFLSRKEDAPVLGHNRLFLLFEVHVPLKLKDGSLQNIQYCNGIEYQDLLMDQDGKALVKPEDGIGMGAVHPIAFPLGEDDSLYLYGYKDYAEFYKQEIFPLLTDFRGEDNSLKAPEAVSGISVQPSSQASREGSTEVSANSASPTMETSAETSVKTEPAVPSIASAESSS